MLYFSRNIKYRYETDSIIICDCKNLIDFELALCYGNLLKVLESGYDEKQPIGVPNEQALIGDFLELDMVSDDPCHVSRLNTDVFGALGYSEHEFFI